MVGCTLNSVTFWGSFPLFLFNILMRSCPAHSRKKILSSRILKSILFQIEKVRNYENIFMMNPHHHYVVNPNDCLAIDGQC